MTFFMRPSGSGLQQGDWEGNAERLYGLEVDLLISAVLRGKLPSPAMSDGHDQSAMTIAASVATRLRFSASGQAA
jgi:hypothetical protein